MCLSNISVPDFLRDTRAVSKHEDDHYLIGHNSLLMAYVGRILPTLSTRIEDTAYL